jgi:demethylmenaquinone methyltransferase/2-methoxy-6-polyprenyl-1,4-benzoquinol methylase
MAVTISFGLRNIDPLAGRARCGGDAPRWPARREFSHPTWNPFRTVYVEYLHACPAAHRPHGLSSPDAYVYLAESIRVSPDHPRSRT